MTLLSRKVTTTPALAAILMGVFLFAVVFSMPFGMQTDEHGNMPNCPFMSEQTSVCSMGVTEHIAKWQELFTAVYSRSDALASMIFMLLTFVLLAVFTRVLNISIPALALSPPVPKNKSKAKLFNYLVVTFSQGILNPRLYA